MKKKITNKLVILYNIHGDKETFYFDDFTFFITQYHLAEEKLKITNKLN